MAEEAALAVYLNEEDKNQWRLSFVAVEHELDKEGGLIKNETASRRYTYLLGKDAQTRTAAEQLAGLAKNSSLKDFKDAFSVEALNREFYAKLYKWYDNAKSEVRFPNKENSLIRLLTRLLFVWFIKEKNMVDNDLFNVGKLQKIICWDKPGSFYKAVLQNLFFATLNCPVDKRAFRAINGNNRHGINNLYRYRDYFRSDKLEEAVDIFSRTPFLNGGLFECLDREGELLDCFFDAEGNSMKVPNELFFNDDADQPGLIDLLSQYQFTVEESTPLDVEVALDPELMGQIFENLLADYNPETQKSVRKSTGSYYTPRHIVDYMVTESLKLHLEQALLRENEDTEVPGKLKKLFDGTNEFDDRQTEILIQSIDELRVLDPAVGSGAFPMGILQRLVGLLESLDPKNQKFKQRQISKARGIEDADIRQHTLDDIEDVFSEGNDYNNYGRKLCLIKNVIFGVDIQPIAIHIAKLRFFISLAIEQSFDKGGKGKNYGVRPLPNLEIKFVCADSLTPLSGVSPEKKNMAFGDDRLSELKEQLFRVRRDYFDAAKEDQKKRFRKKDKSIRQEIELKLVETASYTSETRKKSETRKSAEKIGAWDPYDQTGIAKWFDNEYTFGISDGFDLVIGNPPYIQLQKDSGKLGKKYKDHGFKTFASTADIYCLFYERANGLLKQNGICSFITSNKWMRTGYGEKLRNYFVDEVRPLALFDLGPDVFRSATVDTNIFFYQKAKVRGADALFCDTVKNRQIKPISESDQMPMPSKSSPWSILSRIEQRIVEKINRIGTPLKEWDIYIYYGIKTGFDRAFIIDNETKEKLVKEDPKSAEIIKPLLRGRDIQRYGHNWEKTKLWLIATFPALKVDIDCYPAIKRHLLSFGRERLEQAGNILPDGTRSRKKTIHSWHELQDTCAYHAEFDKEKIVWPETTKNIRMTKVSKGIYLNKTCFFITGENLEYILGILNSLVALFYSKQIAPRLGREGMSLPLVFMGGIPIPRPAEWQERQIVSLVDKILEITSDNNRSENLHIQSKVETCEHQINQLVYKLYQLTEEEISEIARCTSKKTILPIGIEQ